MNESAANHRATPNQAAPVNGHAGLPSGCQAFTSERLKSLVTALEEPFDPGEIKWRVTNTAQVGSRNGPRLRGQMVAYADPRAYADRLNELLTPAGWTQDYTVQLVQNFERKEPGSSERTITAKIVVTCKVTIHGFGAHSGLGEEWADNDNAGTAADAQAFKRACSSFGLGRYLYDVEAQWVDLDERKRPLETPHLPEWARPKAHETANGTKATSRSSPNSPQPRHDNGTANRRGGLYRDELLAQVQSLCKTVGFSLAANVLKTVANVEKPAEIRDLAKLTAVFEKLEDLARGVERLRVAIGKVGEQRYTALSKKLSLAGDSIDDIPDKRTLRRLLQALEDEAGLDRNATGSSGKSSLT